jgi:D-hexose-6-phosphate mutarotase
MHAPNYDCWNAPPHSTLTLSPDGLPLLKIRGAFGTAAFSPQGAHLVEFTPAGNSPCLFASRNSFFAPGKAVRGGIPVIFPWFGPREGHPEAPMHGLVRTRPWNIDAVQVPEHGPAVVRFSFKACAETLALWPHDFELALEFRLSDRLEVDWTVRNTGPDPFHFEQALHPYFPVGDVHSATVLGLRGAAYLDKTDGLALKTQNTELVAFQGETDRLYLDTTADCILDAPALRRRLTIEKTGSDSSVVWNPWIAKAAALPDLADDEWRDFVCVEQVNASRNAVALAPGASHFFSVRYIFSDLPAS